MRKIPPSTRWILAALVFVSLACNFVAGNGGNPSQPPQVTVPAAQPTMIIEQPSLVPTGQLLHQWAISATASSEYGSTSWTAMQATGAPNVDECGDNGLAWASFSNNTLEWIELTYATPVVPTEINIYQSYNPSQVVEVNVISPDGVTYTVWTGNPERVGFCPDQMTITIDLDEEIVAQKVVITIDQSVLNMSWNEIDAVELIGRP